MIIKEFKHKSTGAMFTENPLFDGWYTNKTGGDALIPPYVIESSGDWEEVKPWNFETFDGKYLVPGERTYVIYKHNLSDYGEIEVKKGMRAIQVLIYFSSKEARDEYLAENRKLFSARDIVDFMVNSGFTSGFDRKLSTYPNLRDLALSKLKS